MKRTPMPPRTKPMPRSTQPLARTPMPARTKPLARRAPATTAAPSWRTYTCADCGATSEIFGTPQRRLPQRCASCRRAKKLADGSARRDRGRPCVCADAQPRRTRKSLPHRNEKRRPAALASAQRELVMERAGGRCEFEIPVSVFAFLGEQSVLAAERCPNTGKLETAHVVRRHKFPGPLAGEAPIVYSADVALAACTACHNRHDGRSQRGPKPIVPEERRLATFYAIRFGEVRRILAAGAAAAVVVEDLSEILPAGEWSVENQFALIDAARGERKAAAA